MFQKATNNIDPDAVAALQRKYQDASDDFNTVGDIKYLDIPYWIAQKIRVCRLLGLNSCERKSILDIGTGPGYFGAVCQSLGHSFVGTDIHVPMYDDICRLLGVDRRVAPTRLRKPLQTFNLRFDLTTVMWQVFHVKGFHEDGARIHWTPDDWAFFFDDIVKNHLTLPGALFVYLNKNRTPLGEAFDDALMTWSRLHGADTNEQLGWIWFKTVGKTDTFAPGATIGRA